MLLVSCFYFWKNLALRKIGVEPNIRRIGEFKSYGDMLTRNCMSSAAREVEEGLLSSLSDFTVGLLARDTDRTLPQVEDFVYNRDVSAGCYLYLWALYTYSKYKSQAHTRTSPGLVECSIRGHLFFLMDVTYSGIRGCPIHR